VVVMLELTATSQKSTGKTPVIHCITGSGLLLLTENR